MIFNPYIILAMLLAAIGLYETGQYQGYKRCDDHHKAQEAAVAFKIINDTAKQQIVDKKLELGYIDKQTQIRTVYIKEKAKVDEYKNHSHSECNNLGDKWLQLYNQARINTANAANTTE